MVNIWAGTINIGAGTGVRGNSMMPSHCELFALSTVCSSELLYR